MTTRKPKPPRSVWVIVTSQDLCVGVLHYRTTRRGLVDSGYGGYPDARCVRYVLAEPAPKPSEEEVVEAMKSALQVAYSGGFLKDDAWGSLARLAIKLGARLPRKARKGRKG